MSHRGFVFKERPNEVIDVSIEDEKSPSIMPPKSAPLTQAVICRMIKENVDVAITAKRARQENVRNDACGSGIVRVPKGVVQLRRWFEKTKSVFGISEFVEGKKDKFAATTLQGPALTWSNAKVATMGLETVYQMPWTEMKQLMTTEFCPIEEVQIMEHEPWNLKVKEYNVVAYIKGSRFNELALMCSKMVEHQRVKVYGYIQGLTDNLKVEVPSSKHDNLNEAVRMAHKFMEQKSNKTLIVKSDKGVSRLEVISCIKACKCVERGPPLPRQVEFRIDLVPGVAPVARAQYRLAHVKQ
nr:hypothetical protein [Tanacetum cinerariifolium]